MASKREGLCIFLSETFLFTKKNNWSLFNEIDMSGWNRRLWNQHKINRHMYSQMKDFGLYETDNTKTTHPCQHWFKKLLRGTQISVTSTRSGIHTMHLEIGGRWTFVVVIKLSNIRKSISNVIIKNTLIWSRYYTKMWQNDFVIII